MDLRLKGRVALVTGASKGIGKAIARGLAQEGVNLVVVARGKEALEQAADQIRREQGVRVLALQADAVAEDEQAVGCGLAERIHRALPWDLTQLEYDLVRQQNGLA